MLSRREMVGKLAAGAAVAWTASAGRASAALMRRGGNREIGHQQGDGAVSQTPEIVQVPVPAQDVPAAVQPQENQPSAAAASAPAPWELLRPLAQGSVLAYGWRVLDLSAPTEGACVLSLQNERGRTYRIHLCRNDGRPEGLVFTDRFDMVVMNGGRGDLHTEEGLAQAVAEVAHVLAANERAWRRNRELAGLLPHAERMRQFATENSWALR
jgi:hypothetical protein